MELSNQMAIGHGQARNSMHAVHTIIQQKQPHHHWSQVCRPSRHEHSHVGDGAPIKNVAFFVRACNSSNTRRSKSWCSEWHSTQLSGTLSTCAQNGDLAGVLVGFDDDEDNSSEAAHSLTVSHCTKPRSLQTMWVVAQHKGKNVWSLKTAQIVLVWSHTQQACKRR